MTAWAELHLTVKHFRVINYTVRNLLKLLEHSCQISHEKLNSIIVQYEIKFTSHFADLLCRFVNILCILKNCITSKGSALI